MTIIAKHGGKDVYFLSGNLYDINSSVEELHPAFVCVIFLHKNAWSVEDLKGLIERLLLHGGVYFLFHGNRCEEAHDIADEACERMGPDRNVTYNNVVGTDWFDKDSEEEVLFAAFVCVLPSDDYLEQFSSYVVVSIGTPSESARIRNLLENLESTLSKVTAG